MHRIGIIGAGMIGSTTARLFVEAGHEVAVSNSRGPASLASLVKTLGPKARAMTGADAAQWADIVLLAIPWRTPEALPPAETVAGKIVVDAMNPYMRDGTIADLGTSSSSEETRKRLPGARLVKAFNTIWFTHLAERGRKDLPLDDRHAIFVAGDDADAKKTVITLIAEIGFGAVDTGSLAEGGRRQQPSTPLYNKVLTVREATALARSPV
ncbi:MAG TPA: NADPH-dependent F420 reductase [Vicinamibacterales bacterium]|jgi:predicted dinucleotide-binding enzyme|nr:NADPH-dependent F420 reductase [Vicinamibacterales bacterium]